MVSVSEEIIPDQKAIKATSLGLIILMIWIATDNIIGATIFSISGSVWMGKAVLYLKYAIFISLGSLGLLKTYSVNRISKVDFIATIYLILVVLFTLIILYKGSKYSQYLYLYIIPILIYFTGKLIQKHELEKLLQAAVIVYIIICIFGLVDYFLFGSWFWGDVLNYGGYITTIKGFDRSVLDGLPGNFYFDPFFLRIRRFVGTQGDPLAFAYFSMTLFFLVINTNNIKYKKVFYLFFIVCVALSITRAIILVIPVILAIFFAFKKHKVFVLLLVAVLANVLVMYMESILPTNLGYRVVDSSVAGHIESNINFITSMSLEKIALGSLVHDPVIYEPGIFNITSFFGVTGLILFIIFLNKIITIAFPTNKGVAYAFAAGLFLLCVFSQSFFSTGSSWLAWLAAGSAMHSKIRVMYGNDIANIRTLQKKSI